MHELLTPEFIQRTIAIGCVVAIVAPTVGLFFVVRRYSTIADTLAHMSLAGAAIGMVTGLATIPTALMVSIVSVLGMEKLRERKTLPGEAITALFMFGGLALGVVLLGRTGGNTENVENFLFGDILSVTNKDLLLVTIVGGAAFLITLVFWRAFFAVSIDEDTAEANGLPVKWLNRLLAILGAVTIAISMNVVGVLLIGALMVIPVLAAMQFRKGFHTTWVISLCISIISVIGGLFASYYYNLASGGTIVLGTIVCFILASILSKKTV